jgi:2-keto-3-deoxygluconate transporter
MKIYRFINRVPGGMMVVPLFIGMAINTFFPNLLRIGGFTQALTGAGYPTILGMYLFTVGTKMTVSAAPKMLMRGLGIMATKVGTATIFALVVAKFFGGRVIGLSTLAVMVAMSDTNGGMFLALTSVMGDEDDAGTYVLQSIETGPFLTMLIFVGTGLAVIPWLTMVSVVAPIVVGAILGNLDGDIRDRSRRDRSGRHRFRLHLRRQAARWQRHRGSGGLEHGWQFCRGAASGGNGRRVVRIRRWPRDRPGCRVRDRDRPLDAAPDVLVVQEGES